MSVKDEDREHGSRGPKARLHQPCGAPGLWSRLGALSPRKRMVVSPRQLKSGPQDTLSPTCDCVTWLGRRDFADVTFAVLGLEMGTLPGIIQWAQCRHQSPKGEM